MANMLGLDMLKYPVLPAQPAQPQQLQTGGPLPAVPAVTHQLQTGGPLPATPVQPRAPGNTGIVPPGTQPTYNAFGPAQTVEQMASYLLDSQGAYLRGARRNGLDVAQERGLLNGNMAAQSSERAAIDAAQPLISEGMNLVNSREQRALTAKLQSDQALQQDWLNSNQYNREFNGNLSLIPISNSLDFMKYIFQKGAEDPEVFTPNTMAGMQNFFTQSMLAMLQQFFPNSK